MLKLETKTIVVDEYVNKWLNENIVGVEIRLHGSNCQDFFSDGSQTNFYSDGITECVFSRFILGKPNSHETIKVLLPEGEYRIVSLSYYPTSIQILEKTND